MKKKVIILGASGLIGSRLFKKLGSTRALGTYYQNPIPKGIQFNALSDSLEKLIPDPINYSHAILLFGESHLDECAQNWRETHTLNVKSTQKIIHWLSCVSIKPIFSSSDIVFGGTKGNYTEKDIPDPILTYGKQKIEVEKYILKNIPHSVIARFAKVYTDCLGDETLLTSWVRQIKHKEKIRLATDQIFSPVYIDDVVEGLIQIIKRDLNGIYHIGGPLSASRLVFFNQLCSQLNKKKITKPNVIFCSIDDLQVPEKRPKNTSLSSAKIIRDTGMKFHKSGQICKIISKRMVQK